MKDNFHISQHTGGSHGSVRSYAIGLVISLALTVLVFGLVIADVLGRSGALTVIAVCAVAQIFVQLSCFMHMGSSEQWWNRTSLIFTLLTIAILVIGSLWVMNYLHFNMHPDSNLYAVPQSTISTPHSTH